MSRFSGSVADGLAGDAILTEGQYAAANLNSSRRVISTEQE